MINAKYITHCGYSIENNIARDIRLSRNVVNKESMIVSRLLWTDWRRRICKSLKTLSITYSKRLLFISLQIHQL